MTKHARLSPSNNKWPYCPGSVREEANYQDISGEAAIDGTGSHLLLEMCMNDNVPASHYLDQYIGTNHHNKPTGWLVDQERCNRVQICLDYIERRKEELQKDYPADAEIIVESESKSNPGEYFNREDWWGTCDITIKASLPTTGLIVFLEVIDYKDGHNYVSEKKNTQLISYLFGKLIEINDGNPVLNVDMRMTIVQPKTGTPIRYMCSTNPDHGLDKESLMSKIAWLNLRAKETDDPDAPLIAGKYCQWCNHNPKRGGSCTVEIEKGTEVIETMTTDISTLENQTDLLDLMNKALSDIKSIESENLSKILDIEAGFNAVFEKVRKEVKERINLGEEVPGYAMVPGRASKVWNDEPEVIEKKLKARKFKKTEIYPSKLISPAQTLKHPKLTESQKKKIKEELISEVVGDNVLKKVTYEKEKDVDKMFDQVSEQTQPEEIISFL